MEIWNYVGEVSVLYLFAWVPHCITVIDKKI
jgi:hypothetical protein